MNINIFLHISDSSSRPATFIEPASPERDSDGSSGRPRKSSSNSRTSDRPGYGSHLDGANMDTVDLDRHSGSKSMSRLSNRSKIRSGESDSDIGDDVTNRLRHLSQYDSVPESQRLAELEQMIEMAPAPTLNTLPSGDSLFPSSSQSDSMARALETSRQEIENLKSRLRALEDLNEAMKKELSVYNNLKSSIGIQSSPVTGSHSSQTGKRK